ncbi:MAG: carbohydrate binding domain-containing protein [Clostridia bacterium]|nr:carbohydrate binding domain-containing protein [Clostridia bacterium]
MNMRKLIALFSAVIMLCCIIPLSVSAEENLAPAYSNWTHSSSDGTDTATIADQGDGTLKISYISNYGWAGFYLKLEANTDYDMSFQMKGSKSSRKTSVSIKDSGWSATIHKADWTSADLMGTDWISRSFTFNTGSTTSFVFLIQSGHSSAWDAWIKDVKIVKTGSGSEPETPVEPENPYVPVEGNLLQNPSIETGTDSGWTYSGTVATNELAHSGSYSLKSTNNSGAQWKTMAKQAVSVTANTDYTLSFWYYYAGDDSTASFYAMANDPSGSSIVSKHIKDMTPHTWNQVTVEFNSGANTSVTVYAKNGTANSTGTYYFDDFVLVKVGSTEPEEPETPSGGVENPIAGNLVKEGTFENGSKSGWSLHNGTAPSTAAAYKGSYGLLCKGSGWNGIANTVVTTEIGKSYRLTFWYKINVAGFNWSILGVTTETKYGGYWQNTNLGTWQKIEVEFVADDTQVQFKLSGLDENTSPDFYVDTVSIMEIQGPSNDGFILNGDFEVGTLIGWSVHQNTVVSDAAAYGSNYGVNLKGNGGWGGMLDQAFKTTKGLKYILTLDLKVNNYGVNMQVRNVADDANLASQWFKKEANGEWATYTFEFTAVSADTYINFCGGGGGSSTGGEDVYVDNIMIVEIPCEHQWDSEQDADCNICGQIREVPFVEIMLSGGNSASEDVKGLAFKFDIETFGAETDNNNKYTGTATVKPYGNNDEYKLVTMGAVISNKAENSTEAKLNLNTVNGKNVIDVEAVYLLATADDSASFAARIINIPESKADTTIYARPYYVFEKDGEQIVIYGDIVSKSYAAVIG